MAFTRIPDAATLSDEQFLRIEGPDSLHTGFQYDAQQRTLYFKESQVIIPSFHGQTHIAEDPIPAATCDLPGLMSANDKCKLDGLLQTRIGVLGFSGAGFCVLPGTPIELATGGQKKIEEIVVGDEVLTRSGLAKKISAVYQRQICESIVVLSYADSELRLTADHKVWATKQGESEWQWVRAAELSAGDFVSGSDTSKITLIEVLRVNYAGFVHDIGVVDDHSYIAAGIIIHNSDDGGWLQGDVILAAGTDYISLERFGNVIRFTVDSPLLYNCACEECLQIFWVQDESSVSAIRPPTCGGKLPNLNSYGELGVYLFPESTIADPNDMQTTLNRKGTYPSLVFKRYDDAVTPGSAEFDLVLKRDAVNQTTTEVGWAFTPGVSGVPECVFFTGKDNEGNQIRFDLDPVGETNLLGSLLYKGHLVTKQAAVITNYTGTILSTNQYMVRFWDIDNNIAVGEAFTARNVWQYNNPENQAAGSNPQALQLDSAIDLLPIGTVVDLWFFKIGESGGSPVRRYYFCQRPYLNPANLWAYVDGVQFGDLVVSRDEIPADNGSDDAVAAAQVSAVRTFEHQAWGLTGFDDPFALYSIAEAVNTDGTETVLAGTEDADISYQHRAVLDTSLPGLKVLADPVATGDFSERPVYLWQRRQLHNALLRLDLGRPTGSEFSPVDIILRGDIDEHRTVYMRVIESGQVAGYEFIRVKGVNFNDLPPFGAVRVLYPESNRNLLFNYTRKLMYPTSDTDFDSVVLAGINDGNPYPGAVGDIIELLHQEYSSPCLRLEFAMNNSTGLTEVQFKVGTLSMSERYEETNEIDVDDYIRGLDDGYAVSAIYSQSGFYTGVGTQPDATPEGFVVYEGGTQVGSTIEEIWNRLEVMVREDQVWVWWNQLLVPPSGSLSAELPSPVSISTPYFTIPNLAEKPFGKFGVRLWPGSAIRRLDLRTQLSQFSEYQYGQLALA